MQDVKKHRDIKFITTEARTSYLVSKPHYNTIKRFSKDFLVYLRLLNIGNK